MRTLLFLIALLVFSEGYAQCEYIWHYSDSSGSFGFSEKTYCPIQRMQASEEIPASCNQTFRKKFLDSIVNDVVVHPLVYPMGLDSPGVVSDFRIYKYDNLEIAHYGSAKYPCDGDTILVHDFSFSGWQPQWNEDACFHFHYTVELGVIFRYWFGIDSGLVGYSYVEKTTCLPKEKLEKLRKCIADDDLASFRVGK